MCKTFLHTPSSSVFTECSLGWETNVTNSPLFTDKPKDEKADSFAEKLATNVIKNLQIEISDIHIRYEDHFTNPNQPFAAGVTLKNLSFQVSNSIFVYILFIQVRNPALIWMHVIIIILCTTMHQRIHSCMLLHVQMLK